MPSAALSEKPENMLPLQPSRYLPCRCLVLFLSLMLFGGLAGCGPASDNPPNVGPQTSMDSPFPHNDAFAPAANSLPLASVNGAMSVSGRGDSPGSGSPHAMPVLSSEPTHPVEGLVVPESMAQKLNSPNVLVRLRALEAWAREAPPGAVDPFILAFEDKDERVRVRAQQLIEQDWARKAEAEKGKKARGSGIKG